MIGPARVDVVEHFVEGEYDGVAGEADPPENLPWM